MIRFPHRYHASETPAYAVPSSGDALAVEAEPNYNESRDQRRGAREPRTRIFDDALLRKVMG